MAKTTPATVAREKLFQEMSPATQKVAKDLADKMQMAAKGLVLLNYDIGARVAKVMSDEAKYGGEVVTQLAAYLNWSGGSTSLYALANFANEFERKYVEQESAKPMANGTSLAVGHFIQVSRVKSKADQKKLFTRIRQDNLSVNSLEEEIRANYERRNQRSGGRRPSKPASPAAGLQRLFSLGQSLDNYLKTVADDSVFDAIDEMPADKVDTTLKEKIVLAREQVARTQEDLSVAIKRLDGNMKRVTKVLGDSDSAGPSRSTKKKTAKKKTAKKTSTKKKASAKKKTPTKKTKKGAKASAKKKTPKTKTAKRRRPAPV